MLKTNQTIVCEYIWIGGLGEIRSKTRVIKKDDKYNGCIPDWNYDGSSTGQAGSDGNTEVILKPCFTCKNPLRIIENCDSILVLCDTYDINDSPIPTNYRYNANILFNKKLEEIPWFGLEQEYFFEINNDLIKLPHEGMHYCGISANNLEREIVEKHLSHCLFAGLQISGINAEVSLNQWEFQIGPCIGIQASDQLIIARYLLERVAEMYNVCINYYPKPSSLINGSGCHINFSTESMRNLNGLTEIMNCMEKLEQKQKKHIAVYGKHNELRLTGKHETSDINKFSYGIGTRNTSVRIPNQSFKDNCGYFEDRRPASNIDPYQATSIIFKTCCLDD